MQSSIVVLRKEIYRLHEFFVAWFTGELQKCNEILSDACISYFHPTFHLIPPSGVILPRDRLIEHLATAHGTYDDGFEILIHDIQIRQELSPTIFLVSYQEWQWHNNKVTARLTTAVLEMASDHKKLCWRHVHETWIDGKTPADNATSGMPHQILSKSSLISRRRHVHPQMEQFGAQPIINNQEDMDGVTLKHVQIISLQGTIASDAWLTDAVDQLEILCQDNTTTASAISTTTQSKRRLGLPEMVFDDAIVKIVLPNKVTVEWTAIGALQEWAKAHQSIPLGSTSSCNGVSVLKALDAHLWSTKQEGTKEFHYDWSFSTPYLQTGGFNWIPLHSSGMNRNLLQDTSQPILYFDENQLYEDDLHDNGVVTFTLKTRVMPTCLYVLSRLWLRIDGVLLRVKETRLMVEFGETTTVHRDVLWRECHWSKLDEYQLPTDIKAWRNEDGVETSAWQELINRLPLVSLPDEIPQFTRLEQF